MISTLIQTIFPQSLSWEIAKYREVERIEPQAPVHTALWILQLDVAILALSFICVSVSLSIHEPALLVHLCYYYSYHCYFLVQSKSQTSVHLTREHFSSHNINQIERLIQISLL